MERSIQRIPDVNQRQRHPFRLAALDRSRYEDLPNASIARYTGPSNRRVGLTERGALTEETRTMAQTAAL